MDAKPVPRGLAPAVRAALADTPVVCLLGPRQCGKTTLARSLAPDYGYVTFDDEDALTLARSDPNGFLAALPDPVILDEIQRAPDLLRALKLSVDRDRRPGRFLLTGSANLLLLPKLGESLAGRMAIPAEQYEAASVDGPVVLLQGDLIHHPYRSLAQFLAKTQRYARMMAEHDHARGKRASLAKLVLSPAWRFWRGWMPMSWC